ALVYLGAAYLVADTGYPGGISEQARLMIIADLILILSLGGWYALWRKGDVLKSTGRAERLIAFTVVAVTLAGVGLWFLVQAFKNIPVAIQ
ncbi:MAG: hypothetical protein ACRDFQ_09655, partial [Anaerolineales bacterium]